MGTCYRQRNEIATQAYNKQAPPAETHRDVRTLALSCLNTFTLRVTEAATCYLSSINLYCQVQRFSTAARLEVEVAELMKKDR